MTPSSGTTPKLKEHNPSFGTKLAAVFLVNLLFVAIATLVVVLVVGAFLDIRVVYYVGIPLATYMAYTLTVGRVELRDGNPWPAFAKNLPTFNILRRLIGLEIMMPIPKKIAEATENDQFIFAFFPHGANSDYRVLLEGIMHDKFPKVASNTRTLSASVLFRIPLVREIALFTGCVDASRAVAERLLNRGRSLLIIPGGEAEQIRASHGKELLYLQNRKGFVKLAVKKNIPLVPVYVFGCSDMYHTSNAFFAPRHFIMKTFGVCIPLAAGLWGTQVPLPVKTTIVMGEPMTLAAPKNKDAITSEELDAAHTAFCKALEELFDKHKTALGYGDRKLNIM